MVDFFKNKDNIFGILIVLIFGILFAIGVFAFDITSLPVALVSATVGSVLAIWFKESKRAIENSQKWYSYLIGYVLVVIVTIVFWNLL